MIIEFNSLNHLNFLLRYLVNNSFISIWKLIMPHNEINIKSHDELAAGKELFVVGGYLTVYTRALKG